MSELTTRKYRSNEPFLFEVTLPATAPIAEENIEQVRLLIDQKNSPPPCIRDVEINEDDWEIDGAGEVLTFSWSDEDDPLPAGTYDVEVWVYEVGATDPRKVPSAGRPRFKIEKDINEEG